MKWHTWNGALGALALASLVTAASAADEKPKPTLKTAIAGVGDISAEVARIDKRLAAIEQSVAEINASQKHMEGIDRSLAPVGRLTSPQGLTALVNEVSDVAFDRGVWLILIATGCAAALILLVAFLTRWILLNKPRQ